MYSFNHILAALLSLLPNEVVSMVALAGLLFQRIGLLLVLAFIMTRVPAFRYLLDRRRNVKALVYPAVLFGIFGIIGIEGGAMVRHLQMVPHGFVASLAPDEVLVGPALVATVIAGLFGGPFVGILSGGVTSAYTLFLGGDYLTANLCIYPLSGFLSGLTARFFSHERVIASQKAFFIGMFAPILHMGLLLVFTTNPGRTIALVNFIGLPLVVTNSSAIAVFTAMIRVVLREQEQAAAVETQRAFKIAEKSLPHLRNGLNLETAEALARLLYMELKISAVSVADSQQLLSYIGIGEEHHQKLQPIQTRLAWIALETGELQIATSRQEIQCIYEQCPINAVIMVPLRQSGEVVGLITLCFQRSQQLRQVEINLALGLGKLISNQLDVAAAQQLRELTRSVKLRNLQAQIQPHFLFNTLQMISTLIRVDPALARHVTIQLGHFMRMNLRIADHALIPLEQELDHLQAYLEIINVRFADKLKIICSIPEALQPAMIPPFSLQLLVENSVKHGLEGISYDGEVCILIVQGDEYVEIEVKDNGYGIPTDQLDKLGLDPIDGTNGAGIGLFNLNQRLIGLLGNCSALHFENIEYGGCAVYFQIPIKNRN